MPAALLRRGNAALYVLEKQQFLINAKINAELRACLA